MYGTIRMHQEREYPGRVSATELRNPDFAAYARAFGGFGVSVERTEDFPGGVQSGASVRQAGDRALGDRSRSDHADASRSPKSAPNRWRRRRDDRRIGRQQCRRQGTNTGCRGLRCDNGVRLHMKAFIGTRGAGTGAGDRDDGRSGRCQRLHQRRRCRRRRRPCRAVITAYWARRPAARSVITRRNKKDKTARPRPQLRSNNRDRSLRLDAGGLDDRPPFLDLGLLKGVQRLGRLLIGRINHPAPDRSAACACPDRQAPPSAAALSLAMMSFGVPLGAHIACQNEK